MPTKYVKQYEIEYTAERLRACNRWGAYVSIFTPSANPMHRHRIVAKRRVSAHHNYATETEAQKEAVAVSLQILERRTTHTGV